MHRPIETPDKLRAGDGMEDISIVYGRLQDRPINFVSISLWVPAEDCIDESGDFVYEITLNSFIGCLDINPINRGNDIELIIDAVENGINGDIKLEAGCRTDLVLTESGEWEGTNWNKYYVLDRSVTLPPRFVGDIGEDDIPF